jgi:hypothetical protein
MGRRGVVLAGLAGALAAASMTAGPVGPAGSAPTERRALPKDACSEPEIRKERRLLCPDLEMRPPFDLAPARSRGGTPILQAANSIDSVGQGPASLRGRRKGRLSMKAKQLVWQRGGGKALADTGAKLAFKRVPGQGRYWKFRDAARFELWELDTEGNRRRRVEVGPKQVYCLRDLRHTHPGMKRSPNGRFFPGCSQNPRKKRVTLGTSVGWSDVYPRTYHQNFIELDDVPSPACYAYVHIADPKNGILELDESNNEASTVVHLSPGGRWRPGRCEGVRDRALPLSQTTDDSRVPGGGGRPYRR